MYCFKRVSEKKIQEMREQNLSEMDFEKQLNKITDKACLCNGLTASTLMANNLDTKMEGTGVSICPGPNLPTFSGTYSLKNMVDHIYGRTNVMERTGPAKFICEGIGNVHRISEKLRKRSSRWVIREKEFRYLSGKFKQGC